MNNIILINMTSIVSPMPTFSDLPIDIITYILSLCECDITKESHILDFNKIGRLKKKKNTFFSCGNTYMSFPYIFYW